MPLAAILAMAAGALFAQAPSPVPVADNGLLVLRNGQSLQGKISRVGDLYYVVLPEGEIRLRATEVDVCCRDLEEGYQRKRAMLPFDNAIEHLQLAQWCQRQKLWQHAAEQIAEAKRSEPTHPMIPIVERRLQLAMAPPPASQPAPAQADPVTSIEELDRMVRDMPAGTVETFTQTIQPVLMNNCTASGCHGLQAESKYHLLRTPLSQPPGRRLTQRNLYETLKWVDRDHPEASALLKAAATAHGESKGPAIDQHHGPQYQKLAEWVQQVSGKLSLEGAAPLAVRQPGADVPGTAAAVPGDTPSVLGQVHHGARYLESGQSAAQRTRTASPGEPAALPLIDPAVRPAAHVEPLPEGQRGAQRGPNSVVPGTNGRRTKPSAASANTPLTPNASSDQPPPADSPPETLKLTPDMFNPRPKVQHGATIVPFVPADPFDPEIYNRRYFPKKSDAPNEGN